MKKKRNSKAESIYRNINKNKKINKNIRLNNNDMIDGTLSVTRKGFGFVTPLGETDNSKDVFVPAKSLGGAFDGDLVRISSTDVKRFSGKSEGKVVKIIKRDKIGYVGTFEKVKGYGFVIPENKKIHKDIFVEGKNILNAKNGDKVFVEITSWPENDKNSPEGKITKIIAKRNSHGADIKAMIADAGIPAEFSDIADSEAKHISSKVLKRDMKGRRDLRTERIFTIDGADSKDFDDAVSLKITERGTYLLGVHIADVSHYVRRGSALDKEALERGNSVYLIDQVVPMLPKKLSNGICSLNPGVDRLALSVNMEVDREGNIIDHEIFNSVIHSKARLVYTEVSDLLEGKNASLYKREPEIAKDLMLMGELAGILFRKREKRGSIEFDFDEPNIILDKKGKVSAVEVSERRVANKLIEEFMLLANETVAEHFYWLEEPFIYRVHEKPDLDKIKEVKEYIGTLGLDIKIQNKGIHSAEINNLLNKVKGKAYESVVSTLLLRSMKKAYYDVRCLGHFGLGTQYYCHFTSPIRRYPDLMIHRIIKDIISCDYSVSELKKRYTGSVEEAAALSSASERKAVELEREVNKLKMTEYMADHIGEVFYGVISGVTGYGFFVQLPNTIEGMVRLENLRDDFYEYKSKKISLIGMRTGKTYSLGQEVRVVLTSANVMMREIEFEVI